MNEEKIVNYLNKKKESIISEISSENIEVYTFLLQEFKRTDVSKNRVFQFTYRSFYRLDNAGLSLKFKEKYFELMQKNKTKRGFTDSDIRKIIKNLSKYPRIGKGKKEHLQFSFTTKLLNTINRKYPIYDSKVATLFKGFRAPLYRGDLEERIDKYLKRYTHLKAFYKQNIDTKEIRKIISLFDKKFKNNEISDEKKLDFILWAGGKIKG